jgi:Cdc6-like AAA superfamily ATPase
VEDKWYLNYDFDSNPFEINPIKDEPRQLIGLEDLEKEIVYRILSGNMLFIEGDSGKGKTALLRYAIDNFRGHGKVMYVDSQRVNKVINVEELLINANKFRGRILGKKPKRMILLIDNIESLTKRNWERIKYYFDQDYIRSVVFTGKNYKSVKFPGSIKSRIGNRIIKLNSVTLTEAIQIIQERLGDDYEEILIDDEIKILIKISKFNIKKFMMNCYKLAQYKMDEDLSEVDEEEIKKALNIDVDEEFEFASVKVTLFNLIILLPILLLMLPGNFTLL